VREAFGPGFPIGLRLSQWKLQDYTAKLAATPHEIHHTARQSRDREKVRKNAPQAGVDRLKPVPPMRANDLPVVGQALSPANQFFLTF